MVTDRERKRTGKTGEDEACRFLTDRGHIILERNWRYGHLEIDIISMDRDGIHFVEVKTRRPPMQAGPQEAVNATKRKRIAAAASKYLASRQAGTDGETECQFDIVAVTMTGDTIEVEYYPEAFYPVFT